MSQAGRGPLQHTVATPISNIYTALTAIALLALIVGIGYVWYRSVELFGTGNPFTVVAEPGAAAPLALWLAGIN